MAGEWIKVQNVTPNKPEVFVIADALGIDPDAVVGKLLRVWVWADEQTTDGYAPSVTQSLLDRIAGVSGFADAMLKAGWLHADGDKFEFPNFDRHNGETSKSRALASKRMQRHRSKKSDAAGVTLAQPEKRREEKNKSVSNDTQGKRQARPPITTADLCFPEGFDSQDVRDAVEAWLAHKRSLGKAYKSVSAVSKLIGDWLMAGPEAFVDAINHSMAQNYQGVYARTGGTHGRGDKRNLSEHNDAAFREVFGDRQ